MPLTAAQTQLVSVDLAQAFAAFHRAYQQADGQRMLEWADRINRDLLQLGRNPLILYPGYKLPEA